MASSALSREGAIATLKIDRAEKMNALDRATLLELREHVADLARQPAAVVVVESAGDKVFVAGADIEAMSVMGVEEARRFSELGHAVFDAIEALPSIVLAVVQGAALGGACDLVLAGEKARFGQPETNLGLIPGFGGCARLLRRVGPMLARDLVYTGRLLSAAQAHGAGLVSRVVAQEELAGEAKALAEQLAKRPPLALARAKAVLAAAESADARTAARVEIEAFAGLFALEDTREGLGAFLAKRPAVFRGR